MKIEHRLLEFLSDISLSETEFEQLRRLLLASNEIDRYFAAADYLRRTRKRVYDDFRKLDDARDLYERVREIFPDKKAMPGPRLLRLLSDELGIDSSRRPRAAALIPGLRSLLKLADASTILSAAERAARRVGGKRSAGDWPLSP